MIRCPVCGGNGMLLGVLGNMAHFRCLACGLSFHADAELVLELARGDEEEEEWERAYHEAEDKQALHREYTQEEEDDQEIV